MGNSISENEGELFKNGKVVQIPTSPSSQCVNLNNFEVIHMIGFGFYSKVFMVKKKGTKDIFAMKVMEKEKILKRNEKYLIMGELQLLEIYRHPFMIDLHFAFQDNANLYLVEQFANGGELFYHLRKRKRFKEEDIKLYIAEIILALNFLHSNAIIYRDLKPENILIDSNGHVKLTDFGLCKFLGTRTSRTKSFLGSSYYLAPELILKRNYGIEIDLWSLGTLIYELIFGIPPFYSDKLESMYHGIVHGEIHFPKSIKCSKVCKKVISKLLKKNPAKRMTLEKLMHSKWFDSMVKDKKKRCYLFKDIYAKRINPSFIPTLSSADDVKYIDEEFLNKRISNSSNQLSSNQEPFLEDGKDPFEGFEYNDDYQVDWKKEIENNEKIRNLKVNEEGKDNEFLFYPFLENLSDSSTKNESQIKSTQS